MMSRYITQNLRPRFAAGLSLTLLPEGHFAADLCLLERHHEDVTVVTSETALDNIDAIKSQLKERNAPFALAIHGRGVLHRHVPNAAVNLPQAIRNLLPGANSDDFSIQVMGERSEQYISLIRNELLHQLLSSFVERQILVTDVSLGPFRFKNLIPYLNSEETAQAFSVDGYQFKVQVEPPLLQELAYIGPTSASVNSLEAGFVPDITKTLSYALALALFQTEADAGLITPAVIANRQEWRQRIWNPILTWSVLGILFMVLLTNFFIFSHLSTQSQQAVSQGISAKAQAVNSERLQQDLAQKERFLRTTGWLEPSRHSIYADDLAASLPLGIQLLTLDSHPVDGTTTQAQHRLSFKTGVVFVKGQCRDAIVLNAWLQQLEKLSWVKSVREQSFAQDYVEGIGTFSFALVIK